MGMGSAPLLVALVRRSTVMLIVGLVEFVVAALVFQTLN